MTGNKNGDEPRKKSSQPEQKPKKKSRFIILKLLLFILLCLVVTMFFAQRGYKFILDGMTQAESIPSDSGGTEFTIPYGSTTVDIAQLLKEKGYLMNTQQFRIISKLIGFDGLYKAGRYMLTKDMNDYALMMRLTADPMKNPSVDIRIPEGQTVSELADTLAAQKLITREKFILLCKMHLTQFTFQKELTVKETRTYPLEGYLYPDTYKMDSGWDEEKLVLRMLDEFNRNYTDDDRKQAATLDMTTDEVVTMASLIEMEAVNPADMKKISSVFHNRLASKDLTLLQSDATIQYARILAGLERTTTVLFKDLEIDSPYNTYVHPGLPPGPICSPRAEAIQAALHPEKTKYLYFFATPDGTNIYNETYNGHLADQKKYGVSGQ